MLFGILFLVQVLGVDYQKAMANIRNCIDDTRPPIRIENKVHVLHNIAVCV